MNRSKNQTDEDGDGDGGGDKGHKIKKNKENLLRAQHEMTRFSFAFIFAYVIFSKCPVFASAVAC